MKKSAVIMGAGDRGMYAYGRYSWENPEKLSIKAVAEPDPVKLKMMGDRLGIDEKFRFSTWEDLLNEGKIADGAIIAMMDDLHVEPSVKAMELGYDILLEKPMDRTLKGSMEIYEASRKYDKKVMVAHVLRYTDFYRKLREVMHSGIIGTVKGIEHKENIGYYHMGHSFVRGNWRNSEMSSPIILAKSCHDMDLLYWLTGKKCLSLSSYGRLSHFNKENKPLNSSDRCLTCAIENECPYSAKKLYLTDNDGWPVSVITTDLSEEGRIKALTEGPYGRCVYDCDNDVMDHQVVSMEFEDDVFATFTLSAFTAENTRTTVIFGTKGELRAHLGKKEIELAEFGKEPRKIDIEAIFTGGHSGGDYGIMESFTAMIGDDNYSDDFTSAGASLESHLMCFAAEESRKNDGEKIDMQKYRKGTGK